jgi:hypothetical protein
MNGKNYALCYAMEYNGIHVLLRGRVVLAAIESSRKDSVRGIPRTPANGAEI